MAERFPALTGSWRVVAADHSAEGMLETLRRAACRAVEASEYPGILLSGGIDSSLLALLTRGSNIPCFTLGGCLDHHDVQAASRLAELWDLDLKICLPNTAAQKRAHDLTHDYPGDDGVLLALEFAARFCTDILATDGIDEQVGGYWWHANASERFASPEAAFEHFWGELEPAHLGPMFLSAQRVGVNLRFVYLDPVVVSYIARVPLVERVRPGQPKAFWRDVARLAGVPEWIINRPKRGFLDALSKMDRRAGAEAP